MVRIATLPNDRYFPQLKLVTDRETMKKVIQQSLPEFSNGRLRIDYLKLLRFHIIPGRKCRICYFLRVKNLLTGGKSERIYYGVIEPNPPFNSRDALETQDFDERVSSNSAFHLLPEFNMALWRFPNDPALKQLKKLYDKNTLFELLQNNWPAFHFPQMAKLQSAETSLVKYVPEDRCTQCHHLYLTNADPVVIYSKMYNSLMNAGIIFTNMKILLADSVQRDHSFVMPEPLFCLRDMNTIFFARLKGVNLDDCLDSLDFVKVMPSIASGLAAIHQCRMEGLPLRFDSYLLSRLTKAESIVGGLNPEFKSRIEHFNEMIWERQSTLPSVQPTLIHGAFRLSQLLWMNKNKLALMDFDELMIGNPTLDMASFMAHLLYLGIIGKLDQQMIRRAIRLFCLSYIDLVPWAVPLEVLGWQTAAYLVGHQAAKCVKHAKKNYQNTIDKLFNLAEMILSGAFALV